MDQITYDISKNFTPENICNNFIRCSSIHSHNTRASTPENVYINCIRARTNLVILLQFVEQKYGTAFHLEYTQSPKNFFFLQLTSYITKYI